MKKWFSGEQEEESWRGNTVLAVCSTAESNENQTGTIKIAVR
jgi:hypothetical protein